VGCQKSRSSRRRYEHAATVLRQYEHHDDEHRPHRTPTALDNVDDATGSTAPERVGTWMWEWTVSPLW
jgi:hypothetical protein